MRIPLLIALIAASVGPAGARYAFFYLSLEHPFNEEGRPKKLAGPNLAHA
jgi:hypothetical protein